MPKTDRPGAPPTRDFTVAVFVVAQGRVLLHWHRKLGMWLPPGGHIELGELPDDAALRETLEETGIAIRLAGEHGLDRDLPGEPRQLVRPAGIQLEDITPGHQHIDLVYFAEPRNNDAANAPVPEGVAWYDRAGLDTLPLTAEVRAWTDKALDTLDAPTTRVN
ncbi:MAG: NUDIX domain-containing protein [Chloroflexia bacterium]|nr:NUDIX domain-containing protein [Chloroflexia bacterium]